MNTKCEQTKAPVLNSLLETALHYSRIGWTPIPLDGKKSVLKWGKFQMERPTIGELHRWWKNGQNNIGIITGKASGILVLDVDGEEGYRSLEGKEIPDTPMASTGGGPKHEHHYYRLPKGICIGNSVGSLPGLDIRCEGAYIVAPPSIHPDTGQPYEWVIPPWEIPLAEAPAWLLELCLKNHPEVKEPTSKQVIPKGQRNDTLVRIAGAMRRQGATPNAIELALIEMNETCCQPHLPENEVRVIAKSISRYEPLSVEQTGQQTSFPEIYSGIAGEFATLYSAVTEVPKPFLYMVFLTYLGAYTSPFVELALNIHPQPRLYTVCLAPTGDKKSTALRLVDGFFRDSFPSLNITVYGAGSFEGLAQEMAGQSRIYYFDELAGFANKAKQEGSILLPGFCTLFEMNHFDNVTKSKPVSLRNAYISIVSACTAETYERLWNSFFLSTGFINRLFVLAESQTKKVALPRPIGEDILQPLRNKLKAIVDGVKNAAMSGKLAIPLDEQAAAEWERHYLVLPKGEYSIRLDTIGFRLMLILAINERKRIVDLEIVKKVELLLDYELSIRRLYAPIDAENQMAMLEEKIRRELGKKGPMTKRELQRATHAERVGTYIFNRALENLRNEEEVQLKRERYYLTNAVTKSVTNE